MFFVGCIHLTTLCIPCVCLFIALDDTHLLLVTLTLLCVFFFFFNFFFMFGLVLELGFPRCVVVFPCNLEAFGCCGYFLEARKHMQNFSPIDLKGMFRAVFRAVALNILVLFAVVLRHSYAPFQDLS